MTDLRLEAVHYDYPDGVRALIGIELAIPAGQTVALIGGNGSGKTTLAKHLVGLLRPSSGRVLHDGDDVRGRSVANLAGEVGLCFQQPDRQIFGGNVRSEVEYGARRQGASDEEAFARAKEALAQVGMANDLDQHPDDLGETRRKLLTIASVLIMETPVVVLDEPTTGLDSNGVARVETIVERLRDAGRTVIGISHDMAFVAESFERVVVLDAGRIQFDGSPAQVFAEAAWPTLRATGLEPPEAARLGVQLGLGSTPTESSLAAALAAWRQGGGDATGETSG